MSIAADVTDLTLARERIKVQTLELQKSIEVIYQELVATTSYILAPITIFLQL